jgi:hypothetical protein
LFIKLVIVIKEGNNNRCWKTPLSKYSISIINMIETEVFPFAKNGKSTLTKVKSDDKSKHDFAVVRYVDEETYRKILSMSLNDRMVNYLDAYDKVYTKWCEIVQRQLKIEVLQPHEEKHGEELKDLKSRESSLVEELKQDHLDEKLTVILVGALDLIQKALRMINKKLQSKKDKFYNDTQSHTFYQAHPDANRIWCIAKRHGFSLDSNQFCSESKTIGYAEAWFKKENVLYDWNDEDSFHYLFIKTEEVSSETKGKFTDWWTA